MVGTSRILDIAVLTAKDQGLAKVRGGRAARVASFGNAGAAVRFTAAGRAACAPLTSRAAAIAACRLATTSWLCTAPSTRDLGPRTW